MRTLLFSLLLLALSACAGSTTSQGALPPATAPVSRPPAATVTPGPPPTAQMATPAASPTPTAPSPLAEAPSSPTSAPALPTPTPFPFPPRIALDSLLALPDPITYLTHAGDGSGRLFVVEKAGRVRIIAGGAVLPAPFLDISDQVLAAVQSRACSASPFRSIMPRLANSMSITPPGRATATPSSPAIASPPTPTAPIPLQAR